MAFKEKKQENNGVDQAWECLYQRFENDGLLPIEQAERSNLRPKSIFRWLSAAAILIACLITGWHFTKKTNLPEKEMLVLQNEANAPTLATMLEDGSVVYLSEKATLQYPTYFETDKREVMLQGDAFFDIKKQSERPFIIDTELAKVEVTGTSFRIKSDRSTSFLLSVHDGEVRVSRKNRQQVLSVKAGEMVLFDAEQLQLIKNTTNFNSYFKYIQFKDERLTNVAAILNLHSDSIWLKIDPAIEERTITFPFSIESNIAEIAKTLCLALNLQYIQQENVIYISNQP